MKRISLKFVILFCITVISVLMLSIVPTLASSMSILISDVYCTEEMEILVPIIIRNSFGFVSASIVIEYDASVLTIKEVEDTGLLLGQIHNTNYSSPYTLTWVNDGSTSNNVANGIIAYLVFEVSEYAEPGEYEISISAPEDGIIDANGNVLDCSFVDGAIIVMEEECSHSWSSWKRSSSSKHKHTCNLCGEVEYDYHEWDDGEVTEEPTEDSTGEMIYTCDICGGTKTSVLPALEPEEPEEPENQDVSVNCIGDIDYTVNGNVVTVNHSVPCKVGYNLRGASYVAITATANRDGTYSFTAPSGVTDVLLVVKGDVNGDGSVTAADKMGVSRSLLLQSHPAYQILDSIQMFAADLDSNSIIIAGDKMILSRSILLKSHPAYQALIW